MDKPSEKASNPYLAGALTGLLAVISLAITGKYFGASTTFVRAAGMLEKLFAPDRVAGLEYFAKEKPVFDWQFLFVLGIFLGALIASVGSGTFCLRAIPETWEKRFGKSVLKRAAAAFIGGVIAMFGARLADGCPSGHGLSGLMQLAASGFIALACFFIGGTLVARLLYGRGAGR